MRHLLLALLFLPAAALAQPVSADDIMEAARVADLAQTLLNPEWLSLEDGEPPPGSDAFFASAHQAYVEATRKAFALDSMTPEGVAALSDSDVARIDRAARSFLNPSSWSEELADVVMYMKPASERLWPTPHSWWNS